MKAKAQAGFLLVVLLILAGFFARPAAQVNADDLAILKFSTMVGVPKAYTAGQNPIRGINGGGIPWVINGAEGKLTTSGKLNVRVTGLVFDPNDPTVIERGLANQNTVANFRAVVSCQTLDGKTTNVSTGLFPATVGSLASGGGSALIETRVSLPKPCIAPLVFITSPTGAWFAVTGH